MDLDTLDKELFEGVQSLLKMARELTYNHISDNLIFIIHRVDQLYTNLSTYADRNKLRIKSIRQQSKLNYNQAVEELKHIFNNIFEINLYVYKANKSQTIIEIEVTNKNESPLSYPVPNLYCKVPIPPYVLDNHQNVTKKFDINWESSTLTTKWKMYLWKLKFKKNFRYG